MSQMLPEGGEVMRRVPCADVCPAPAASPTHNRTSENKELLRQQLLSASKERSAERAEPTKVKHARSRQKNRWKLKFHHQALPQEYLDHYEQSLQKASAKKKQEKKEQNIENMTNETFKIWAQRLAGVQNESGSTAAAPSPTANVASKRDERKKKTPAITPSKVMSYEDLPYMGEMTLNNSKPRRGRKPKKADICHLIYENYGTVVPGQPPPQDKYNSHNVGPTFKSSETPTITPKTDLQNRIISSLLERKLSQENKRRLESIDPPALCSPDEPMPEAPVTLVGPLHSDDEPLNLCIRDLHDLKLQIQKKFGNIYTSGADVKTEVDDSSEPESVSAEQPNAISVIQRNTNVPPTASSSPDLSRPVTSVSPALSEPARADGRRCWPPAPLYMHPLALHTQLLYYQRLAAGRLPFADDDLCPPTESTADASPGENKSKLVLKQISELLDPKVIEQADERRSPERLKKRVSPAPPQAPAKRKRSAIFIPPMPAKNSSTTPTAEVSICKFKFTGGSKPSLQEKKMLSVDAGGNFRYYSGTGTKGNKGYDFLQRDANSDRSVDPPLADAPKVNVQTSLKEDINKKKRKTRKTLQREKLEQTFKEKGFLIQTQQLQSAEGATYCKFRQLRKFTRYLFRSWKDYLPGELGERPTDTPAAPTTVAEW